MKTLRCLIIEDEPLAAEILSDHITALQQLELVGICSNAVQAMNALQENTIDLIFLDLHLPRIKGFEFLQSLANPPQVIVTTAYQEYALQGYEYNVVDYLLKPIEFPRFLKAIQKLRYLEKQRNQQQSGTKQRPYLFFNVNKKKVRVYLDEILYIESLRDYVRIYQGSGSIVSKISISHLERQLPADRFQRIHRSFLINTAAIKVYDATTVEIKDQVIPIGRNYRKAFEQYWERVSG